MTTSRLNLKRNCHLFRSNSGFLFLVALLHSFWRGVFQTLVLSSEPQWEDLIAVLFLSAIRQMKTLLSFCVETSPTIGFLVTRVDVEDGKATTTVATEAQVLSALAEMHLTADDLVVAVGHEGVISLANHVANKWCGGVSLATVPLDLAAVIVSSITPRALDTDTEHQRLVTTKPCARFCFADLEVMDLCDDSAKVAQVCMVATAMSDNEAEFGRIWDRADNLSSGVADIVAEQLAESTKTRGRLSDSSAIAISAVCPLRLGFLWRHFARSSQLISLFLHFMQTHCVSRQELQ